MNINTKEHNINELFSINRQYYIDFYQRDYQWRKEHVDKLIEDLFYRFGLEYKPTDDVNEEAATPLTNWHYTRNPGGAIYGFDCSVDNSFMTRIKNRTPAKGLYLASAWGNSGPGYAPGLKGGERTFEQVLEDLV